MPVNFLTEDQNQNYCRYPSRLTNDQLDKYFYFDDQDRALIGACRRDYNKIGYALQLGTVRFLGTFLANPIDVPSEVKDYVARQLKIKKTQNLSSYMDRKATRLSHNKEIKEVFGYSDFDSQWFPFTRWLYTQAWFGNDRPNILFERCTTWLNDRKILLPGLSTLVVLISKVRDRVTKRLWSTLASLANSHQKEQLETLLLTQPGKRYSRLDELKSGPTNISSTRLIQALSRYQCIRDFGIRQLNFEKIPKAKINHLARIFHDKVKKEKFQSNVSDFSFCL